MRDADIGKLTSAEQHPVLVVGNPSYEGGSPRVAPGSGTKRPDAYEIALIVEPEDCEPGCTMSKRTRFRLNEARRVVPSTLFRRLGKLRPEKMAEMERLRGTVL
jgi:hypothetical protein